MNSAWCSLPVQFCSAVSCCLQPALHLKDWHTYSALFPGSCVCCVLQERQDALYEITDDASINMMVVVGGFNSSNTSHLQEIAEHKGIPSFWVDSAARIDVEGNKVGAQQHGDGI